GCAIGDHVVGEGLACEGWWFCRIRLRFSESFAIERGLGRFAIGDGEQRLTGLSIENEDIAGLGDLRDSVDLAPVAGDGDQARGSGKIEIPDVVAHALEMPDALSSAGVEGEDAISKQIIADAVGAVKIEGRRAGGGENHTKFR